MKTILTALVGLVGAILSAPATEFQVSIGGNDGNAGTPAAPFRTIQHAADVARPGELVAIKDSERVTNWVHVRNDVWKVILPNSSFGSFNPYRDLIHGDWFSAKGRKHHTGAVYLNGEWLGEASAGVP